MINREGRSPGEHSLHHHHDLYNFQPMPEDNQQNLTKQLGGKDRLRDIIETFYDRVFDDPMIGFLFTGVDQQKLIDMQVSYIDANLGDGEYEGTPIRKAHREHPILPGHFDRRHEILRETLEDFDVDEDIANRWLEFEQSLRPLIIQTGEQKRSDLLDGDE
jgi:hemoglobin